MQGGAWLQFPPAVARAVTWGVPGCRLCPVGRVSRQWCKPWSDALISAPCSTTLHELSTLVRHSSARLATIWSGLGAPVVFTSSAERSPPGRSFGRPLALVLHQVLICIVLSHGRWLFRPATNLLLVIHGNYVCYSQGFCTHHQHLTTSHLIRFSRPVVESRTS